MASPSAKMTSATPQAAQVWAEANSLRKSLQKQLDKMQANTSAGVDLGQFEAVDKLIAK
jgi:capsule polysaccharide export protein KpsE/RkpR